MPVDRFYSETPLNSGDTVHLSGQEFVHLVKVMRAKEAQEIELINGKGGFAKARIESIQKKDASLLIIESEVAPPPPFTCILAQAIPRINRLEIILEKGTELGMSEIWLFPGDFSERKVFTEQQKKRMQAILIAATKQCGRLFLPQIHFKPPLKEWTAQEYPLFFGDVSPTAPPFASQLKPNQSLIFCVGPEKGFSKEEEAALKTLSATGVKLHPNILRTDTAPLAALSVIHQFSL